MAQTLLILARKRIKMCDIIFLSNLKVAKPKNKMLGEEKPMENYVNAELEVVAIAAADTISASVVITPGENELPVDKYWQV